MSENFNNSADLRKYLLGQISDEDYLRQIEERLFLDNDFFEELEITEDGLIEDYINDRLGENEIENFQTLFLKVPERREKIRLTRALVQLAEEDSEAEIRENRTFSLGWIFQPKLAFGFLTVVAAVAGFWFVFKKTDSDRSLANLKLIYKDERPVQSRPSNFEYAPFVVTRGTDSRNKSSIERRRIELDLEKAVAGNPNEKTFNALGIFYLTEKRFEDAVSQFEKGNRINPQNAEINNNLGAAMFEQAKLTTGSAQTDLLNNALERLNKALETNPNLLESYYNKALVLQQLNKFAEAKTLWRLYLEKDGDSKWSEEARKQLRDLENY